MADPRYPDADLGAKREADLPTDDPAYKPGFYTGNGPPKPPKKPKDMPALKSAKAQAMKRRIDLAQNEE